VTQEDLKMDGLKDEYDELERKAMKKKYNKKILKERKRTGAPTKPFKNWPPTDPKFANMQDRRNFWGSSKYTADKIPQVQTRSRGLRTVMKLNFGALQEVFCSAP